PEDEQPYLYQPPAPYDTVSFAEGETLPTYRYLHSDYWRPTAWTPEAQMQVKTVTNPRLSPDGKRVAYVVAQPVMTEEKSETVSQIYLAEADGSDSYQVTYGDKSSANPQWSPDGKWLAFTSSRSGKNQIYRLRVNGGEAEPLTEGKADVGLF